MQRQVVGEQPSSLPGGSWGEPVGRCEGVLCGCLLGVQLIAIVDDYPARGRRATPAPIWPIGAEVSCCPPCRLGQWRTVQLLPSLRAGLGMALALGDIWGTGPRGTEQDRASWSQGALSTTQPYGQPCTAQCSKAAGFHSQTRFRVQTTGATSAPSLALPKYPKPIIAQARTTAHSVGQLLVSRPGSVPVSAEDQEPRSRRGRRSLPVREVVPSWRRLARSWPPGVDEMRRGLP